MRGRGSCRAAFQWFQVRREFCNNLNMNLQELMQWLIPDPDECRRTAADLRLANPDATDVQTARHAVRTGRKWAASVGAATGIAASPITMLPAAVADAAAMLKIEGKLAGTI